MTHNAQVVMVRYACSPTGGYIADQTFEQFSRSSKIFHARLVETFPTTISVYEEKVKYELSYDSLFLWLVVVVIQLDGDMIYTIGNAIQQEPGLVYVTFKSLMEPFASCLIVPTASKQQSEINHKRKSF